MKSDCTWCFLRIFWKLISESASWNGNSRGFCSKYCEIRSKVALLDVPEVLPGGPASVDTSTSECLATGTLELIATHLDWYKLEWILKFYVDLHQIVHLYHQLYQIFRHHEFVWEQNISKEKRMNPSPATHWLFEQVRRFSKPFDQCNVEFLRNQSVRVWNSTTVLFTGQATRSQSG